MAPKSKVWVRRDPLPSSPVNPPPPPQNQPPIAALPQNQPPSPQLPQNQPPPPPSPPEVQHQLQGVHRSLYTSPGSKNQTTPPSSLPRDQHQLPGRRGSPYTTPGHQSPLGHSSSSASPSARTPNPRPTLLLEEYGGSSSAASSTRTPSPTAWDGSLPAVLKAKEGSGSADDSHAASFLEFLRNYRILGERCALYKAQVASLSKRGCSTLEVDFEDVIKRDEKKLAMRIGNETDRSHSWLRSAVRTFLEEECGEMKMEEKEKFIKEAHVHFTNKPDSVVSLQKILKDKHGLVKVVRLMGGEETCRAASTLGREIFMAILICVLGKHRAGQSWNGEFGVENVYFFRYSDRLECRIMKETTPSPIALAARDFLNPDQCTAQERKKDLVTVDTLLTVNYMDSEGNLPIYFDDLRMDLQDTQLSDVVQNWFGEHLEYSLALMPSMARKVLVSWIHLAVRELKLSSVQDYRKILRESPYTFDWRLKVQQMDGIMLGVYWFENKEHDAEKDEYRNTMESVIGFIRNVQEHCHQHLGGAKKLDDLDEGELYTAVKLPKILPKLVKSLMRLNQMGDVLAGVRDNYRASRSSQKEPATSALYVGDAQSGGS